MIIKWNIKEEEYRRAIKTIRKKLGEPSNDYIGAVEIGALCVDFTLRDCGQKGLSLDYDVYVANEDTGYGVTEKGMPYDYRSGGSICTIENIDAVSTFEQFKEVAKKKILDFISEDEKLVSKSNEPLVDWK